MEFPRDTYSTSCLPSSSSSSDAADVEEREYLFEKVVTPSDVGKLNRLVIPKQHAERYFPLNPADNDRGGLLLSFEEDRTGRPWRFRYSYWNSSQSYVITKGWSRFVKDKRLDAGDTVSFSRSSPSGRLFIDCSRRRRPAPPDPPPRLLCSPPVPWAWPPPLSAGPAPPILDSVPVFAAEEPKRMRLFGVNLECSDRDSGAHVLPPPQPPSPLQWRLSPASSPGSGEMPQGTEDKGARK